jgi:hypothetical protein
MITMPCLYLPTLNPSPLRNETDATVIATLERKGWLETTPPTAGGNQSAEWDEVAKEWVLIDNPPPAPDYKGLWGAILVSNVYQAAVLPQGMTSTAVNAAATALGLAMVMATTGQPNDDAIRASIGMVLTTATLSQENMEEIVGMLAQFHAEQLMPA